MRNDRPAFPVSVDRPLVAYSYSGLSIRDYFAAAAMQAIISRSVNDATAAIPRLNNGFPIDRSAYADTAYQYADAMIQQRDREPT